MFRIAEGQHLGKPDGSGTFTPGILVTAEDLQGCDLKRLVDIGAIKPLGSSLNLVKAKMSEEDLLQEIEELTETSSAQLDKIESQEKTIQKLRTEITEKDRQIQDLNDVNQHQADKFRDLEGKVTELKLGSERKEKEIAELKAASETKEKQIGELKAASEGKEKQIFDLQTKIQELEKNQPKKK